MHVIEKSHHTYIGMNNRPIREGSLEVSTLQKSSYSSWSDKDHESSFHMLQKIADVWRKNGIGSQYLVYGKQPVDSSDFKWEIVPVKGIWQQFQALWNVTFGSRKLQPEEVEKRVETARTLFSKPQGSLIDRGEEDLKDAFCNPQVINKQSVFEGRKVRVLYNYAPIGFGGERLHFLIVPKQHRTRFEHITNSEYLESMTLTNKLIKHFSKDAYLFHKTGKDAGQSVPHWHMHVVFTSNKAQDIFGKMTVFKNMLWGSSPMKDQELKEKVTQLRLNLA